MRPGPAATLCCALAGLALALASCGDETSTAGTSAAATAVERTTPAGGASDSASERAPALTRAAARRCRARTGELLDSMESLANLLAVGLPYGDYLRQVEGAREVYDGLPVERLGVGCLLAVATPAEAALNLYLGAANEWGDCLASSSCEAESVEPALQRRWDRASRLVGAARDALNPRRAGGAGSAG